MPRPSDKKKAKRHIDAAWDALDAGNGKKALREIDKAIEHAWTHLSALLGGQESDSPRIGGSPGGRRRGLEFNSSG